MNVPYRTCSVDDCTLLPQAKGWCPKHYRRANLYGDPLMTASGVRRTPSEDRPAPRGSGRKPKAEPVICPIDGCENRKMNSYPWCKTHHTRWKVHGDPLIVGKSGPKPNPPCSIADCENRSSNDSIYCRLHHARYLKHGDPTLKARPGPKATPKGPCAADGCARLELCRGLCSMHYQRAMRNEDENRTWGHGGGGAMFGPLEPKLSSDGYLLAFDRRRGKPMGVHRLVMEAVIGRDLMPGENVHHKDGRRTNNDPANLELWTSSQPAGQRATDKLTWARQIIADYEPIEALLGEAGHRDTN